MKATAADRERSPTADANSTQHAHDWLTAFRRIASNCWKAVESNRESAIAGDPEAVHRMRVELTRLRAAARFFATLSDDAKPIGIDRKLRWLNSTLGKARDRDVIIEYADSERYRRHAAHARRTLLRLQTRAHRRLAKKLGSARYGDVAAQLRHWISHHSAPRNDEAQRFGQLDAYCEERLSQWRDEICEQCRHVRSLRRKPLHQLRILSKHYRYMVEALLDQNIPVPCEDFLFCETAKHVHRNLGELRDLKLLRKAIGPPRHGRRHERKLVKKVANLFPGHL